MGEGTLIFMKGKDIESVKVFLELQQFRAVPTALGSLFHVYHRLEQNHFLIPPEPPLMQLHSIPSAPVTVTRENRPLLSLLCSGPNNPRDFSCFSFVLPSRPFIIFVTLLWTFCPYIVARKPYPVLEVWLHRAVCGSPSPLAPTEE